MGPLPPPPDLSLEGGVRHVSLRNGGRSDEFFLHVVFAVDRAGEVTEGRHGGLRAPHCGGGDAVSYRVPQWETFGAKQRI